METGEINVFDPAKILEGARQAQLVELFKADSLFSFPAPKKLAFSKATSILALCED